MWRDSKRVYQGRNLAFGKKNLFFFTMTMVNAELVFNAVTKKLRNVLAAYEKKQNSGKTRTVPQVPSSVYVSTENELL